jgi:hypothetical protein
LCSSSHTGERKTFRFTPIHAGIPSFVIPRQIGLIINIHIQQGRKQAGKRGTYRKDTNVWVYTSAFAKRFGMPQQWIDDDLKEPDR